MTYIKASNTARSAGFTLQSALRSPFFNEAKNCHAARITLADGSFCLPCRASFCGLELGRFIDGPSRCGPTPFEPFSSAVTLGDCVDDGLENVQHRLISEGGTATCGNPVEDGLQKQSEFFRGQILSILQSICATVQTTAYQGREG
jgi:hypothetical protein